MPLNYQKNYSEDGLEIDGLLTISPEIFSDTRGFFFESWNKYEWEEILKKNNEKSYEFVQDNHSNSTKGVLRGLHIQKYPKSQGKLVRCVKGEIFDVAVDLRKGSKTFCKWSSIYLSEDNKKQIWIPKGFAHGFLTISKTADVLYKTTDFWSKENEITILWNDDFLKINWPLKLIDNKLEVSKKDLLGLSIEELTDNDFY